MDGEGGGRVTDRESMCCRTRRFVSPRNGFFVCAFAGPDDVCVIMFLQGLCYKKGGWSGGIFSVIFRRAPRKYGTAFATTN